MWETTFDAVLFKNASELPTEVGRIEKRKAYARFEWYDKHS